MKKDDLEKKYNIITKKLKEEDWDSDMIVDFLFLFPKNVSNAYESFLKDYENKTEYDKKFHYITILAEMKKSLVEIDNKIENELNLK